MGLFKVVTSQQATPATTVNLSNTSLGLSSKSIPTPVVTPVAVPIPTPVPTTNSLGSAYLLSISQQGSELQKIATANNVSGGVYGGVAGSVPSSNNVTPQTLSASFNGVVKGQIQDQLEGLADSYINGDPSNYGGIAGTGARGTGAVHPIGIDTDTVLSTDMGSGGPYESSHDNTTTSSSSMGAGGPYGSVGSIRNNDSNDGDSDSGDCGESNDSGDNRGDN